MSEEQPQSESLRVIGREVNRVEGRAKVTGRANYAADNYPAGLAHVVGVFSTLAHGRIGKLHTESARQMPGVIEIIDHGNVGELHRTTNNMQEGERVGENRPPFEDDRVYYAGQFIAAVVAETFEQARAAARLVGVDYVDVAAPALLIADGRTVNGTRSKKDVPDQNEGEPGSAWARAATKLDVVYTTPAEAHNPMELHASVAEWKGDRLEVHESTQWVVGQRTALARVLGISPEKVTVYSPYIGGGFGGKLFLWPHTVVASIAAKKTGRPVKLVVERKNEFTTVGHRPATYQHMRLAADDTGKLTALEHHSESHTSMIDEFMEECGSTTRALYACENRSVTHRMIPVNVGTPTSMRAPGAAVGSVALEAALDELAVAAGIDPVALRLKNFSPEDADLKLPWSSNHIAECFERAGKAFGWQHRSAQPKSMRDGADILGWGVASACWPAHRGKAQVRAELRADGTATVSCATQDIGTGTYTVIAQVAAEVLEIPIERIHVSIGQSSYPPGPISGGSMVTATVVPAVARACREAIQNLQKLAAQSSGPFAGAAEKDLTYQNGYIRDRDGKEVNLADVLKAVRVNTVSGEGRNEQGPEDKEYSFRCFGAQFVEVRWNPDLARLRVSRVVSAFDVGRVINPKTAKNQIYGAIVMGIGAALLEGVIYNLFNGRVLNDNLENYMVPVHADAPDMEVIFLDRPDPHIGEFGARGLGEIGITGVGAAVINAVYHATGVRVHDLPIRMESLLKT